MSTLFAHHFCNRYDSSTACMMCRLERSGDMGMYEVSVSMSLLGFGMKTMLANFHMCGIMLLLKAVLNMLMRNASPRGPLCLGV